MTDEAMKTKGSRITEGSARKLSFILAVVSIFLGFSELAQAQEGLPPPLPTLFWDGPDEVGNGMIDGGTGTWDLTRTNWTDGVSSVNSAWVQGADAIFATIGGTVTVADVISFHNLGFLVTGYQIVATTGGSLVLDSSSIITTKTADVTATISAPLTDPIEGIGGFTKGGLGTLILSGTNSYSGLTTVSQGILNIQNGSALGGT